MRGTSVYGCLARPLLGTWPTTQVCALTGNRTGDPLVHRPALNPLCHTSQGSTPMFIAVLFTVAKIWKQPKCLSIDEWIKSCGALK